MEQDPDLPIHTNALIPAPNEHQAALLLPFQRMAPVNTPVLFASESPYLSARPVGYSAEARRRPHRKFIEELRQMLRIEGTELQI